LEKKKSFNAINKEDKEERLRRLKTSQKGSDHETVTQLARAKRNE